MPTKPTIHTFDSSDHAEAYDFSMVNCRGGDFIELNNGDLIRMVEAWPVLIAGKAQNNTLHVYDEKDVDEKRRHFELYKVAKFEQRFDGIAGMAFPDSLSVAADGTAMVAKLPGYTAEVRAVMDGDSVDYLEIYDTESGECLNEGSPIHVWPTENEEIKAIMEMLTESEYPKSAEIPTRSKPSSKMSM